MSATVIDKITFYHPKKDYAWYKKRAFLIVGDYLCWYLLERQELEDSDGGKIFIQNLNDICNNPLKEIDITKINHINLVDLGCLQQKNLNDFTLSVAPVSNNLSLRTKE